MQDGSVLVSLPARICRDRSRAGCVDPNPWWPPCRSLTREGPMLPCVSDIALGLCCAMSRHICVGLVAHKANRGFDMFMLDGAKPPAAKAWAYSSLQPLFRLVSDPATDGDLKRLALGTKNVYVKHQCSSRRWCGPFLSCLGNSIGYHHTGDEPETTSPFVAATSVSHVPNPLPCCLPLPARLERRWPEAVRSGLSAQRLARLGIRASAIRPPCDRSISAGPFLVMRECAFPEFLLAYRLLVGPSHDHVGCGTEGARKCCLRSSSNQDGEF